MNPATAMARVLVDELVRHGVVHLVLSPGSRSAPLALAAHEHPEVILHVRIDERSASFLALGMNRVAAPSPVSAVVCTSGTAVANLFPAVVEADAAGVPLVLLTADRPPELRGTGANQTIDQVGIFGATTRWACDLGVAEERPGMVATWRSTVSRAVAEAAGTGGAPPGPVHLNVPFREPLIPGDDTAFVEPLSRQDTRAAPFASPHDHPPAAASRVKEGTGRRGPWTAVVAGGWALAASRAGATDGWSDARRVLEMLAGARRGVVVAGDGGDPGAAELAARWGLPLLAEPTSGARHGPCAIGTGALLLAAPDFAERHRPDLVVVTGKPGLSRPVQAQLGAAPQLRFDPHGRWWDPARATTVLVPASVEAWLLATAGGGERGAGGDTAADSPWLRAWRDADARARSTIDRVLDARDGVSEPRVARDVAAALPGGSLLVAGSSRPIRDLDAYAAPREGLRILGNRGASGIDGFASTAIGAALRWTHGPRVALTGDLGLLHDANGLILGPGEERPSLALVVVHNDGGGIFHGLPQAGAEGFERLFGTPHGVDVADLARVGRHGHVRVERAGDLLPAVHSAVEGPGITLIEVRTDRHATAALHRELAAAVASATGPG